jgi:hypothetical protein
MGVGIGYAIYLAAFFVMIGLALMRALPVVFLGGIVIALFIGGLFYFWLEAWRETERMIETERKHEDLQPVPAK